MLDQPVAQDPLGLTRSQWQADPRQTAALAQLQDTGKTVRQTQIGTVNDWNIGDFTKASARLYFGWRDLDNALAIPLAAQMAPTSGGGIVVFARRYAGTGVLLTHRLPLDADRSLRLSAGFELDTMRDDRQGYLNDGGSRGALKRDELDRVDDRDVFSQLAWDLAADWTLTLGVRHSRVRFRSDDRFITATNPDDSGRVDYAATNPVAGIAWRAGPDLRLYANWGRGFETPTFTELAYRPDATGLNTDLAASRSRHAEVGLKWRPTARQRLEVAVFDIATSDEIVVDRNDGGRSTFRNAGRTTRRGVEVSYAAQLGRGWRTTLGASRLDARFRDAFTSGSGVAATPVAAGNRLPGTPERNAFAELAWTAPTGWHGFEAGLEIVHRGRLYVDDANSDAAPSTTLLNLRAGLAQTRGPWRFAERLRVENATGRRYAGSVIVNESNGRYFEPALPRSWLISVTASYVGN